MKRGKIGALLVDQDSLSLHCRPNSWELNIALYKSPGRYRPDGPLRFILVAFFGRAFS